MPFPQHAARSALEKQSNMEMNQVLQLHYSGEKQKKKNNNNHCMTSQILAMLQTED